MSCRVHIYLLNYDFSPEYAEAHHNGEESENNRKYDWEDELAVTSMVTAIDVEKKGTYILQGQMGETSFSEKIPDMTLFHFKNDKELVTTLACSELLLHSYEIQKEGEDFVCKIFLDEQEPFANPVPGIYIHANSFPKSLL